jgi:hypothetical protein
MSSVLLVYSRMEVPCKVVGEREEVEEVKGALDGEEEEGGVC